MSNPAEGRNINNVTRNTLDELGGDGIPRKRLFEVATSNEWAAAAFANHLDVHQALQHLASGKDQHVRIRVTPERFRAKQAAALEYARRRGMSVSTRYQEGWMLIKDVTEQRKVSKRRGRLERRES